MCFLVSEAVVAYGGVEGVVVEVVCDESFVEDWLFESLFEFRKRVYECVYDVNNFQWNLNGKLCFA